MTDAIWYPFTQMTDLPNPSFVTIVSGKGVFLKDQNGKELLDGYSSLWVNIHGHNHPRITSAVQKQVEILDHSTLLGASNQQAIRLANRLQKIVPVNEAKIFYSDSGSTSVEIACKMAYQYFQLLGEKSRTEFISLHNAYHGDTMGMMGLGGIDLFHEIYHPLFKASHKIKVPYVNGACELSLSQSLEVLRQKLSINKGKIVAVVVEPIIQGAAGILQMEVGTLKGISDLCQEFGVLLIVDEVATGFGRTGKMFACEHEEVRPDIICLAKGISGGVLPLAATAVKASIYEKFLAPYEEFKAFFHGHSYTGNPIACAAGNASLDIFESESVIANLGKKVDVFNKGLQSLLELDCVLYVRGRGLMAGIEIGKSKKNYQHYDVKDRMAHKICIACIERGLLLRPLGQVIPVIPPLSISETEIKFMFSVLKESIKAVTKSN